MQKQITLKVTAENPTSGMRRVRVSKRDAFAVQSFMSEVHGAEWRKKVRGFRESKNGWFSFQCGGGYAVCDRDLLGGTGDGELERRFNHERGYFFRMA